MKIFAIITSFLICLMIASCGPSAEWPEGIINKEASIEEVRQNIDKYNGRGVFVEGYLGVANGPDGFQYAIYASKELYSSKLGTSRVFVNYNHPELEKCRGNWVVVTGKVIKLESFQVGIASPAVNYFPTIPNLETGYSISSDLISATPCE